MASPRRVTWMVSLSPPSSGGGGESEESPSGGGGVPEASPSGGGGAPSVAAPSGGGGGGGSSAAGGGAGGASTSLKGFQPSAPSCHARSVGRSEPASKCWRATSSGYGPKLCPPRLMCTSTTNLNKNLKMRALQFSSKIIMGHSWRRALINKPRLL